MAEFKANLLTPEGKKMMHLLYIKVKEDCECYDEVWEELREWMDTRSIPIVPVDWSVYDDDGNEYPPEDGLFYAQTFETGMGFATGILKKPGGLRVHLENLHFYNGDGYRVDPKKYEYENCLKNVRNWLRKYHPDEEW